MRIEFPNHCLFSARCNIYISHLCHDASPSVRLSVTEVHWRIIANLGFKFRSHFTAHCGRRAACSMAAVLLAVLLAGESSRAMLASARSLVIADPDRPFHGVLRTHCISLPNYTYKYHKQSFVINCLFKF